MAIVCCDAGLAGTLGPIPRNHGRPCVVERRPVDLERREVLEVGRLLSEPTKLVLYVGLVVLENRAVVVLLELSDHITVVVNLKDQSDEQWTLFATCFDAGRRKVETASTRQDLDQS